MYKIPLDKDFYGNPVPNRPVIWMIGDSHTQYLEQMRGIDGYFLAYRHPVNHGHSDSPPTIWQLIEKNSTSRGRRHLLDALRSLRTGDLLLLMYGEVDARVHIPKRFLSGAATIDVCINETVERYGRVLTEIDEMGLSNRIIVHGIVPMGSIVFTRTVPDNRSLSNRVKYEHDDIADVDAHVVEQVAEGYCLLNAGIKAYCNVHDFLFFDIMSKVAVNGRTEPKWLYDTHHLKTGAAIFFEQWLIDSSGG